MFLIFRKKSEILYAMENQGGRIALTPEESRHIKARRLKPGSHIGAGDAEECRYNALLLDFHTVILTDEPPSCRKEKEVILYTALPEGKKTDFLVQKATELMASRIVFMNCERSVRESLHRVRLEKIVHEAAVQSRRFRVPVIAGLLDLSPQSHLSQEWQAESGARSSEGRSSLNLILHPYAERNISQFVCSERKPDVLRIFAGPEGGFTQRDLDSIRGIAENLLQGEELHTVFMGGSVMRTETACIAALAKFC